MKNLNKYLLLFLAAITLSSCFKERIELDLNEGNKKIAIVAWISDLDEPQYVSITKTVNFLGENEPEYVSDARVVISDAIKSYELEYVSMGKYYLPDDYEARIGDTYTLEVVHNDKEYTAEQTMRVCPEIENLESVLYTGDQENPDSLDWYDPIFDFQEIPGEGDAYFTIHYPKNSPLGKLFIRGGFTDDEFIDGLYFEDVSLEGDLYNLGDTVVVDLYSIGRETADFLFEVDSEIFRDGPFDPPPANIQTNITGGAVGFFIASGAKRETLIIE